MKLTADQIASVAEVAAADYQDGQSAEGFYGAKLDFEALRKLLGESASHTAARVGQAIDARDPNTLASIILASAGMNFDLGFRLGRAWAEQNPSTPFDFDLSPEDV